MSKFGKTKKEILSLLSKQQYTLTDLSAKLELSPSTIKQHLEELESAGAILQVENEFIRRWKYYKPNPTFNLSDVVPGVNNNEASRFLPYLVGALVMIAIAGIYFSGVLSGAAASSPGGASLVSVRLTDPPFVPPGTTALYINYSSVQLHTIGTGNAWVQGTGSGTINLLTLVNASQVIGDVYLNPNTTVDKIRFNITAARVVINGVSYEVKVPTGQITAQLPASDQVNANESLLLDFSPTVSQLYNASTETFVMLPSIKAAVMDNESQEARGHIGQRFTLIGPERTTLYDDAGQCAILNASVAILNASANRIVFTVKNNGNTSVDITHVLLYGAVQSNFTTAPLADHEHQGPGTILNMLHMQVFSMMQGWMPAPLPTPGRAPMSSSMGSNGVIMFTVQRNGSIGMPFTQADMLQPGNVLAPGATATFTLNRNISVADEHMLVSLVPNESYRLVVIGGHGMVATANVTAT